MPAVISVPFKGGNGTLGEELSGRGGTPAEGSGGYRRFGKGRGPLSKLPFLNQPRPKAHFKRGLG